MKLIVKAIPKTEQYLLPLGDLHLGAPECEWERFIRVVAAAKKKKALVIITGDIFDTALTTSVTNTFTQKELLDDAMKKFYDAIYPIKDQILGVITGNHEARLEKTAGFNPLKALCNLENIPYCGYSCVIRLKMGVYTEKGKVRPRIPYTIYAHHTTGGGATPGGKLNRISKLRDLFDGADIYIGGHNHMLASSVLKTTGIKRQGARYFLAERRIYLVDSGSFLKWDNSYAEQTEKPPLATGALWVILSGTKKRVKVVME